MTIKAQAPDGPRQRVMAASLEDVTLSTMGSAPRGGSPLVVLTLDYKAGKLPVRMSAEDAMQLIARLMQSLGAALNAELVWSVRAAPVQDREAA